MENTKDNISPEMLNYEADLTPKNIVEHLNKYIIGQGAAKKAVAIALRNRWRRLNVDKEFQDEITPKNIIMIGPTGVGKTEISRRLAKLTNAPFVKVEASKFTEVGYVGRDVESIVRDLADVSYNLVKEEEKSKIRDKAFDLAEQRILDVLLPKGENELSPEVENSPSFSDSNSTREKLMGLLRQGKLDQRIVEIETQKSINTHLEILGPPGFAEVEGQLKDMLSNMIPRSKEKQKLAVADALKILTEEYQDKLLEPEKLYKIAIRRAEDTGIIFIDEIDKICGGSNSSKGPDVSREGVQRDLLPIVEGSSVSTKYGQLKTDHILFIASGAFHNTKPADLMPEFQGRFPIRVELTSLSADDFIRILKEPNNALIKQYSALLSTEGVNLEFTDDAIAEIAGMTESVNIRTENIGARRLHTLLEKLLEELLFTANEKSGEKITIDSKYVSDKLSSIVVNDDLSRFIL